MPPFIYSRNTNPNQPPQGDPVTENLLLAMEGFVDYETLPGMVRVYHTPDEYATSVLKV